MNLSLKTSNWLEVVEREINLCSSNTLPLADSTRASPDYNCLGIPEVPQRPRSPPSVPAKPPPPSRPPLPKSPAATPKHHVPRVGVISVTPELMMAKQMTPASTTGQMSPLKPAPAPPPQAQASGQFHYDVPESPKRKDAEDQGMAAGGSAIYEEIDDDVSKGRSMKKWLHFT